MKEEGSPRAAAFSYLIFISTLLDRAGVGTVYAYANVISPWGQDNLVFELA